MMRYVLYLYGKVLEFIRYGIWEEEMKWFDMLIILADVSY